MQARGQTAETSFGWTLFHFFMGFTKIILLKDTEVKVSPITCSWTSLSNYLSRGLFQSDMLGCQDSDGTDAAKMLFVFLLQI